MDLLIRFWGALEALAGTVSVGFILLISLVLVLFAGVYVVAALVVLVRFARSAQSSRLIALSALWICPLYVALWLRVTQPQLVSWAAWGSPFAWLTGALYLGCALALPLGRAGLRKGAMGIGGGLVLAACLGLLFSFLSGRLNETSFLQAVGYG